jgi:uncharacterized Tic20 family protein
MSTAYSQSASSPLYSCWLRSGGLLNVWPDRVEAGSAVYQITDLTQARLVADPSFPPPAPGAYSAPPPAAVSLHVSSSQTVVLPPVRSGDAWPVLEAIYSVRPDLRVTLPPNPELSARMSQSGPSFFDDPANEKVFAGVAHLSMFFLPIVLPLVIWLAEKDRLPYASEQGKQAFWFHILYPLAFFVLFAGIAIVSVILTIIAGVLGVAGTAASANSGSPAPLLPFIGVGGILGIVLFFLFWVAVLVLTIGGIAFAINGAIKGFEGKPFHYPFLGRI